MAHNIIFVLSIIACCENMFIDSNMLQKNVKAFDHSC